MNSISSIFAYYDTDYVLLSRQEKMDMVSTTMLYVFRLCDSNELTEVVCKSMNWTKTQGAEFRKILAGSGMIQKCLKFFIYERVVGDEKVRPEPYGVSEEDFTFVKNFLRSGHKNVRFFIHGLKRYARSGYPARSLQEFDEGLIKVDEPLRITASKYANKSFRWIDQSGQLNKEDIVRDMLNSALYSMYRAYPEIDGANHMKNIGIRAIHNRGVNILKEQSTQSRQRVFKNADGTFRGDLLSFDHAGFSAIQTVDVGPGGAISICSHLMVGIDGSSAAYERPTDVDRRRDLKKTVEQLSSRLRGSSPKTFIQLMMGEHHAGFSEFLGKPNDEAIDSMDRKDYSEKVREYLKVPVADARKFVLRLREELKDFRN